MQPVHLVPYPIAIAPNQGQLQQPAPAPQVKAHLSTLSTILDRTPREICFTSGHREFTGPSMEYDIGNLN
jgi:hypothetical protein